MDSDRSSWIVLAHLIRPQGRKGELLAELLTDFPDRIAGRRNLFLAPPNFDGGPQEAQPVEVTSSWLPVGRNKSRIVLQLAGVDTISAAEPLAGKDLVVPREERMTLDAESIYVIDLVDCILFDDTREIGRVTGVQFPASSDGSRLEDAAPLLEVETSDGSEVLVPFAKAFIRSIRTDAKRIVMTLPAGLVEVNR